MKTGKLGSFTLALGIVIAAILSLRLWLIPSVHKDVASSAALIKNKAGAHHVPDFSAFADVSEKKQAFFDYLRPWVEQQNAIILEERRFIESVLDHVQKGHSLSEAEQFRVQRIADKYQYAFRIIDEKSVTHLLKRVDIVPESMVLIQAANETGWGSSRFAREGFNFFGQWCFTKGCGLVPLSRDSGLSHEVAVFKSVDASVASYMRNLNSNAAYALFRSIRADLRAQSVEPNAEQLIYGLVNYSERQEAYIDELLDMLHHNEQYLVDTHAQDNAA